MKNILPIIILAFINQTYAQVCFNTPTNFSANSSPRSVTSADFNGDGIIDLAVANEISTDVSILLGTGTGSFGNAINFNVGVGHNPQTVISSDFNGDGKVDLATANYSNDISVLLGNGNGSFGAATSFTAGTTTQSLISEDINGDGKKDLVVVNEGSNNISVLLGTGTGSFGAATNFAVGSFPYSVCSGDFNGDGKADLAVANYNSSISVLLGTGIVSFSTTSFLAGTGPRSIITGDFNGDTNLDLAVANETSNDISILLGNGMGSFNAATNFPLGNGNPLIVISADFNGDGKMDLATANTNSIGTVSVLLGTGTGSFSAATSFTVDSYANSVISADFNGDTKADLATANYGGNNASVLLNCTTVGIANFNNNQEISFHPNPTSDQFFIDANTTDKLTVDLYDVNGRHVFNKIVNDKEIINTTNLNEGIYSLTIKTADRVINKKLVILR